MQITIEWKAKLKRKRTPDPLGQRRGQKKEEKKANTLVLIERKICEFASLTREKMKDLRPTKNAKEIERGRKEEERRNTITLPMHAPAESRNAKEVNANVVKKQAMLRRAEKGVLFRRDIVSAWGQDVQAWGLGPPRFNQLISEFSTDGLVLLLPS